MLPPRVRKEGGRRFVSRVLGEVRRGRGPAFAIVPRDSSRAVGQIRFFDWHRSDRRAEIGYWLQRRHWGKGYGTEAVSLACAFGFGRMRLHRIVAKVVDGNRRSTRVLEHVGFRLEGRSRKSFRLGGHWVDELDFGLLSGELRKPGSRVRRRSEPRNHPSRPPPRLYPRTGRSIGGAPTASAFVEGGVPLGTLASGRRMSRVRL